METELMALENAEFEAVWLRSLCLHLLTLLSLFAFLVIVRLP